MKKIDVEKAMSDVRDILATENKNGVWCEAEIAKQAKFSADNNENLKVTRKVLAALETEMEATKDSCDGKDVWKLTDIGEMHQKCGNEMFLSIMQANYVRSIFVKKNALNRMIIYRT